jgi:hypothetical protein
MLTQDSYSLTVYALKAAKLDNLPAPVDTGTMMSVAPGSGWNWVVNMAHYIESLDAVAVAEYRGTSKAWAANFVPPNAAAFPCTTPGGAGGAGGKGGSAGGAGGKGGSAGGAGGKGGSAGGAGGASGAPLCLQ